MGHLSTLYTGKASYHQPIEPKKALVHMAGQLFQKCTHPAMCTDLLYTAMKSTLQKGFVHNVHTPY